MKIVFRHICSLLALTISLNIPLTLAVEEEGLAPAFEPGYRPAIDTDEAGFWAQVDRFENKVSQSPQRVTDGKLTAYIEHLVCELAGDYCSDIRVYILKNPHFNASMYSNGMMNVWTGLLLRVENEDQLVAVLGHEIGHYLRAHQIERWRSMRNSASVAIFFDMVLTAGLATLAVASNSMAFGRDQELEADQFGVNLMSDKHYDPAEAVALWQYVAEEQSKDNSKSKQSIFFATHPQPKERIDALEKLAEQSGHVEDTSHSVHEDQFISIMSPLYFSYMNDHFNLQENEQTALMLEKHLELGYPKGQVYYFKGRLANRENTQESKSEAEKYFLESVSQQSAPPESYRELGYLYLKNGNKEQAREFFQQYLNACPEASDIKMIEFYLNSME